MSTSVNSSNSFLHHGLGALPQDFDLDSLPYIDGEIDGNVKKY